MEISGTRLLIPAQHSDSGNGAELKPRETTNSRNHHELTDMTCSIERPMVGKVCEAGVRWAPCSESVRLLHHRIHSGRWQWMD